MKIWRSFLSLIFIQLPAMNIKGVSRKGESDLRKDDGGFKVDTMVKEKVGFKFLQIFYFQLNLQRLT